MEMLTARQIPDNGRAHFSLAHLEFRGTLATFPNWAQAYTEPRCIHNPNPKTARMSSAPLSR